MSTLIDDEELKVEKRGALGVICLQRVKALNALSLEMIRLMATGLKKLANDDEVTAVTIISTGDKAFCAGGDVKLASKMGMAYRRGEISDDIAYLYFKEEYKLDRQLYHYQKPLVVIMDGIVMGGGVGIAHPCDYRISTQRTVFAMPEVKIGLFPDVGSTYYLQSWPGHLGWFAVTSGMHITHPKDLHYVGAATHYIDFAHKADVLRALQQALNENPDDVRKSIERVLAEHQEGIPEERGVLENQHDVIDALFDKDCFDEMYEGFHANSNDFMREVSNLFNRASPTSLKISYNYFKANQGKDFDSIIDRDYELVQRFLDGHDFYEGIRAVLGEKTEPSWQPGLLEKVTDDDIAEYLQGLDKAADKRTII